MRRMSISTQWLKPKRRPYWLRRDEVALIARKAGLVAEGGILVGMKLTRAVLSAAIRRLEADLGRRTHERRPFRRIRIQ